MSEDDLAGIGNDLRAMFEELLTASPRKKVPCELPDVFPGVMRGVDQAPVPAPPGTPVA